MAKAKDLVGEKYHRLTVVSRNYDPRENNSREAYWNCLCDCGNTTVVRTASLSLGNTKSCGCLQREQTSKASTTHGMSNTAEYNIWAGIIARCCNSSNDAYSRYGGRGITMCDRWRSSFENFYADMGPRPGPEYSIERGNNDGNYEPSNCRWATDVEQNNNKRNNLIVELNGSKQTLAEAASVSQIDYKIVHQRINRDGMSLEEALTTELRKPKMLELNGESLTIAEWSEKTGIPITTIEYRLSIGWEIEKALTLPITKAKTYLVNGREYTISELSKEFKVPDWKLRQRIGRDGMTAEEAVSKS